VPSATQRKAWRDTLGFPFNSELRQVPIEYLSRNGRHGFPALEGCELQAIKYGIGER
jgi:hypothetical protein